MASNQSCINKPIAEAAKEFQASGSTDEEVDNHSIGYTFDDYYIDSFIATRNKTESFRKASEATNYPLPVHVTQSAYSYHKRIERDGLIQEALHKATLEARIAAHSKLSDLRDNADSENIQFQAAKHQSGDLYSSEASKQGIEVHVNRDNVQIKAGKDTLTIENSDK